MRNPFAFLAKKKAARPYNIPVGAVGLLWVLVPGETPAIHFPPDTWAIVKRLAADTDFPSPQELLVWTITQAIQLNAKGNLSRPPKIQVEWVTRAKNFNSSVEAFLIFRNPSLAEIGLVLGLQDTEQVKDFLAEMVLGSIEDGVKKVSG